jgi:hypothetical protein
LKKQTYFDLLDVVRKTKALVAGCQHLWNERRPAHCLWTTWPPRRYNALIFWAELSFKTLFAGFIHNLALANS